MCLLDTLDAALMLTLYTTPSLSSSPIATLYYSIVLTTITLIVALVIGILQLLTLISNVASPEGKFWDGVQAAGDHYDVIGTSFPSSSKGILLHIRWTDMNQAAEYALPSSSSVG